MQLIGAGLTLLHPPLFLQLDNWSSSSSSSSTKLDIQLPVPAGQLDLAQLLVKGMYQAQPTVAKQLSHSQLLQLQLLLLLADRFEVPKVQAAVLEAFSAVPAEQLEYQTAQDLLCLPDSCAQQPGVSAVQRLALQRLQQDLGDLEVTWNSEQLQQQLLQLPFRALLQLLQHDDTKVASENTVVYTVQQWYQHQPEAQRSEEQLKQLLQQVRMRHCTSLFVSTVMTQCPLVCSCFSTQELGLAWQCSMHDSFKVLQQAKSSVLETYPAWSADKRPASGMQRLGWRLSLNTLEDAAQRFLSDSREAVLCGGRTFLLQGQACQFKLKLTSSGSRSSIAGGDEGQPLFIGLYLHLDLPPGMVRQRTFSMTAVACSPPATEAAATAPLAFGGGSGAPSFAFGAQANEARCTSVFTGSCTAIASDCKDWGYERMLTLDSISSWQQVDQALKHRQLVHAAGSGEGGRHLVLRADGDSVNGTGASGCSRKATVVKYRGVDHCTLRAPAHWQLIVFAVRKQHGHGS
jgi:hypothetical protein